MVFIAYFTLTLLLFYIFYAKSFCLEEQLCLKKKQAIRVDGMKFHAPFYREGSALKHTHAHIFMQTNTFCSTL